MSASTNLIEPETGRSTEPKTSPSANNKRSYSDQTNNDKRAKQSSLPATTANTQSASQSYDDDFEAEINPEPMNESASRLSDYDENSREAGNGEAGDGQEEPSSPKTDHSDDFIDEEDDGTFQGVPLSEIPNICQQPPSLINMNDLRDPNHTFLIKPFQYKPSEPHCEPQPFYSDGSYVDEWDPDFVRLPCSQSYMTKDRTPRWPIIQEALMKLQQLADNRMAAMEDLKNTIEECAGRSYELNCLEQLLNEIYSTDERAHFFSVVLSHICSLALHVDQICTRPPPLLRVGSNRSVTMSQRQAASLLACAFFCLFPRRFNQRPGSEYEHYQNPNFNTLFHGGRSGAPEWKVEKLRCVLHYFRRITEQSPQGVLTFRRYQLPKSNLPKWSESNEPLCQLHITKNKTIEDIDGMLQVDFANKYIGGGVMNDGCVQEEIRFVICPEMLVSLLLCQVMHDDECVFLVGCERFASYRGYARSFQFKEDFIDTTPRDAWGRRLCHVVAMDAIAFYNRSRQYTRDSMKRELVKAYTCFRVPAALTDVKSGIATGNWGCGAFNGNKELKAIIQLIAASQAGRPLVYLTFRDQDLVLSMAKVYAYLVNEKATVRHLCQYLQAYAVEYTEFTLFDYILRTPVSTLR